MTGYRIWDAAVKAYVFDGHVWMSKSETKRILIQLGGYSTRSTELQVHVVDLTPTQSQSPWEFGGW